MNSREKEKDKEKKQAIEDQNLFHMWCPPVSYTHLDVYKRQGQSVVRGFSQGQRSKGGSAFSSYP